MHKIGDRFKSRMENSLLGVGQIVEVISIHGSMYRIKNVHTGNPISTLWNLGAQSWDKLLDPLEEAKKTLEAAGFTIVPPKPKLTGWVNIVLNPSGSQVGWNPQPTKTEADVTWERSYANKQGYTRIACIQFTEGDGL